MGNDRKTEQLEPFTQDLQPEKEDRCLLLQILRLNLGGGCCGTKILGTNSSKTEELCSDV